MRLLKRPSLALALTIFIPASSAPAQPAWQPAKGPLTTAWTARVSPKKPLPEYPRPQLVRPDWQSLNGLWQYAASSKTNGAPTDYDGLILVPFPIESSLSGVGKKVGAANRLWYRDTFDWPRKWRGQRCLLHFGAVDWETTVFVNGKEIGTHRGGYDAFTFDITNALRPDGPQELIVSVWDPSDAGPQPRGKQVNRPSGIWYTSVTGIWQTPWLEPVPAVSIDSLTLVPDIDSSNLNVRVRLRGGGEGGTLEITALDGRRQLGSSSGHPGETIKVSVPKAQLWSPDSPKLYDLKVVLRGADRKIVDTVTSYFGMRKTSLGKDAQGITRIFLNNNPLFEFGPLDQGWWPDGLYTAPTDEALRSDIEITKKLGFNMARKHVKVEPDRWYYWADKLGLLVWQDMPSGGVGDNRTDKIKSGREDDAKQFETELRALIEGRGNHPSIVMWVPFNEGWGQYDTPRICDFVRQIDPSRLVNNASGWTDRKAGDVIDMHKYPGPDMPKPEPNRAAVLGEFGGLGLPLPGHTWQDQANWGYKSFKTRDELTAAYLDLIDKLAPLVSNGLSAAVYTQTTDVEIEVNGLMPYDRAFVKMDQKRGSEANRRLWEKAAR